MKPTSSAGLVAPLSLLVAAICVLVASCNRSVSGDFDRGAAYLGLGDDCNNDVECASHSCKQAMCAPPPAGIVPIDGDCSGGQECVDDAYCVYGICVPDEFACAAKGTPCMEMEDCCDDICLDGVCGYGSTTCTSGGEYCVDDAACCSDYCQYPDMVCAY